MVKQRISFEDSYKKIDSDHGVRYETDYIIVLQSPSVFRHPVVFGLIYLILVSIMLYKIVRVQEIQNWFLGVMLSPILINMVLYFFRKRELILSEMVIDITNTKLSMTFRDYVVDNSSKKLEDFIRFFQNSNDTYGLRPAPNYADLKEVTYTWVLKDIKDMSHNNRASFIAVNDHSRGRRLPRIPRNVFMDICKSANISHPLFFE